MNRRLLQNANDILAPLLAARKAAGQLLLGLDFDGTLALMAPRSDDARLIEGAYVHLDALSKRPDTTMIFISGRSAGDAGARVGLEHIHYAGNHGMEIDGPSVQWVHPDAVAARSAIDEVVHELKETLAGHPDVILEDKRVTLSVHFRTLHDDDEERIIRERSQSAAERMGPRLKVIHGKKIVDIKPNVEWDKGRALVLLRERLGLNNAPAVFIGDDHIDEDAFRELDGKHDYGIIVGHERHDETNATSMLPSPEDVVRFLARLAE